MAVKTEPSSPRPSTIERLSEAVNELLEESQCISQYATNHRLFSTSTGEFREVNCKSWKCPKHRKSWLWKQKTIVTRELLHNPINKIITLTLAEKCSPEQLNLARQLLCRDLRKDNNEFQYLSVLEFTSKTRLPHLHILARSCYIPQKQLSDLWRKATTASKILASPIVYIEAPRDQAAASIYALSYALDGYNKRQDIPKDWKGRKISYSKKFFSKSTKEIWKEALTEIYGPPSNEKWVITPNKPGAKVRETVDTSSGEIVFRYS
jgi:hypothetical protein